MANVQLQKTVNATVTKTAIDQKQSLEVVQTMLHGGLSSLAYLRQFFRDGVFEHQYYTFSADRIHPYADYAGGKIKDVGAHANGPKTRMPVLRRGRSKRVNEFLDWIVRTS